MNNSNQGAKIKRAVEERSNLEGMRKSFGTILDRQRENANRIPDLQTRKDRLRKTKEECVGGKELLCTAISVLQENGFRVALAKNADAAIRMVREELKGHHLVVKSKSNVTKEIHLSDRLAEVGIEVIETDLGDRIIQLAGCEAAHPTGPACHFTRRQISDLFTKHFGRKISEDPKELTEIMRQEIAGYISNAKVGITGANAIAAREGAIVIVHNEGNAAKCAMLPDKHIVITTPEKIVPDLDEAVNVTKLQTYLSTGKIISSYINIITGPSYTADIEKKVFRGMHGPKDVLVILVDDGRLKAADKEPQFCIGCGMCLLHCPVYNIVGPVFGASGHMGGIGVYLDGSRGKLKESVEAGLFACTVCGACTEVCPSKIDTKKGIVATREMARKSVKSWLPEHTAVVASVMNYDNPWQVPRKQKAKWARNLGLKAEGDVLYFAGCSTSLLFPDTAVQSVRVLRAAGANPAFLGQNEECCGSTVRKLGDSALSRKKAEDCFNGFKGAGAKIVVTSCPGCSSELNHYPDLLSKHGIKVQHISKFLDERLDKSLLGKLRGLRNVTYHDPCDLGRGQGVYDEPRKLLERMTERPVIEMERSRQFGACCGSGGGVKSAFGSLANAVGEDRVAMAKAAGANTIVTSCPWCVQNLRECQGDVQNVAVVDLVELLDRSLSEDVPSRKRSS